MNIGKYRINRHTASSLYHRHVRPLWDARLRENSEWQRRFLILTNNFCNLSCYSCSSQCNLPEGATPFRETNYVTPLRNIEKFLDLIEGFRPQYWLRISGGESTLCGPEYLREICELGHSHKRNISLLTNGARIKECDPHWFDFIHLDEHIRNEKQIYDAARYFKEKGFSRFQILTTKVHRDLELQRRGHVSPGLHCEEWLNAISLYQDTVYPCCVLPFLDGWNRNTVIRESCKASGFHVDNPTLLKSIENWKKGVHPNLVYACCLQCWKRGKNIEYHSVDGERLKNVRGVSDNV